MLSSKWQFSGRSRRPPKDPPNAVLSFGYTIVFTELRSLLDGIGFDPYLGYYHLIEYGRASLALDILEIYRHSLVDHLMLNLFNLSILNEQDFSPVPEGGVYLSNEGKKKFFIHYEKTVGHYKGLMPDKNPDAIYRKLFQEQIANLVSAIKEEKGFEILYKLNTQT